MKIELLGERERERESSFEKYTKIGNTDIFPRRHLQHTHSLPEKSNQLPN